ncbi:MAG: L-aspartate oxidase, partial [Aquificaceae bacterium]|nr:L-aspartate oxidase [Aquificaceae bacterium]
CGLERREEDLKDALKRIQSWLECWQRWKPTVENRQLFDITLVAMATLSCALRRKESRGVHYRTDFPYEREEFKRDSVYGLEVSMLRA